MNLSLIVAVGENGEIGAKGQLPWPRLRADMHWFRKQTMGKPVIMGARTWNSLPAEARPLPGRTNIVIARPFPPPWWGEGAIVTNNVKAARDLVEAYPEDEAFVIGGDATYREFLPLASKVYLTKVEGSYPEADAFFPYPLPTAEWDETPEFDRWFRDSASGIRVGFYTYTRKQVTR